MGKVFRYIYSGVGYFFSSIRSMGAVAHLIMGGALITFLVGVIPPSIPFILAGVLVLGSVGYAVSGVRNEYKADKVYEEKQAVIDALAQQSDDLKENIKLILRTLKDINNKANHDDAQAWSLQQFTLLTKLLNDYLLTLTYQSRLIALKELEYIVGDDLKNISKNATVDDINAVNRKMIQFFEIKTKKRAYINYINEHANLKRDLNNLHHQIINTQGNTGSGLNNASLQQKTKPFHYQSDWKKSFVAGVKMALPILGVGVLVAGIVISIMVPPALIGTMVLLLAASGVAWLTGCSLIGLAAGAYDYLVTQPKQAKRNKVDEQYQQREELDRGLTRALTDSGNNLTSLQALEQTPAPTADLDRQAGSSLSVLNQTLQRLKTQVSTLFHLTPQTLGDAALESASQRVARADTSPDGQRVIAEKPRPLSEPSIASTSDQSSVLTKVIAEKPGALSSAPASVRQARRPSLAQFADYVIKGLTQFFDNSSMLTGAALVIGSSVLLAHLLPIAVPLVIVGAMTVSVGFAGKAMYDAYQKDKQVMQNQQDLEEIDTLREALNESNVEHIAHLKNLSATTQDSPETKIYFEFSYLVRAMHDYLALLSHDKKLENLAELNKLLGDDWQNCPDSLSPEHLAVINSKLSAFLLSHRSPEQREAYLEKHPELKKLTQERLLSKAQRDTGSETISSQTSESSMVQRTFAQLQDLPNKVQPGWRRSLAKGATVALGIFAVGIFIALAAHPIGAAALGTVVAVHFSYLGVCALVGAAAAVYDKKVTQPKEAKAEAIEEQHKQYDSLKLALESANTRCQEDKIALNKMQTDQVARQTSRLTVAKHQAKKAFADLNQDFQTLTTQVSTLFKSIGLRFIDSISSKLASNNPVESASLLQPKSLEEADEDVDEGVIILPSLGQSHG